MSEFSLSALGEINLTKLFDELTKATAKLKLSSGERAIVGQVLDLATRKAPELQQPPAGSEKQETSPS